MNSDPVSCQQSLVALSSAPAAELVGDSPLARHLATCPDCSRVARVVLERERSQALALPNPDDRRRTGRFVMWVLIGAFAVTGWFALDSFVGPLDRKVAPLETMTIPLTCLSGDQARDLVQPYLLTKGDRLEASPGIGALILRAPANELAGASAVISEFEKRYSRTETGACVLAGPKAPQPGTLAPTPTPAH